MMGSQKTMSLIMYHDQSQSTKLVSCTTCANSIIKAFNILDFNVAMIWSPNLT